MQAFTEENVIRLLSQRDFSQDSQFAGIIHQFQLLSERYEYLAFVVAQKTGPTPGGGKMTSA